jgi:hypothetical protein
MARLGRWLAYLTLGGVVFWGSDWLLQQLDRFTQPALWISAKTILLPVIIGAVGWLAARRATPPRPLAWPAFPMLLGIWLAGPLYLVITSRLTDQMFLDLGPTLVLALLFPVTTFAISIYCGSVGGLLLTTLLLAAVGSGFLGTTGMPASPTSPPGGTAEGGGDLV